jgi:hypothetical protein
LTGRALNDRALLNDMALSNRETRGGTFMVHLLIRSPARSQAFAFIALGSLVLVLDADAQGMDATRLNTPVRIPTIRGPGP